MPDPKRTVLVVDDDPDVLEATRVVLESAGYEVETAETGEEGLLKLRGGDVDAVLLDVMMTRDTEGFGIAHDIRENDATADIPIIMITSVSEKTGFAFSPDTDEDFLPVDAFLEKPVDPDRLLDTLDGLLNQ